MFVLNVHILSTSNNSYFFERRFAIIHASMLFIY